jgi:hypothetical protein
MTKALPTNLDATGKATVTITDTESTALAAGTYKADAKVTDANGIDTISETYTIVIKERRS